MRVSRVSYQHRLTILIDGCSLNFVRALVPKVGALIRCDGIRPAGPFTRMVVYALLAWFMFEPVSFAADTTNSLTVRGVERMFILHVPPSYDGSKPVPVLFMFHGLGSTAAAAASEYYDWQATADTHGFIVVFPDSLTPPGKNIEFPPGNVLYTNYDGTGKRWDVAHVFSTNRCDSQDIDFVIAILDWLESNYNIRTSHIFATGHSYGAFFSYYCAVCLHDAITAFAEHSGGLYQYVVIPDLWIVWWPVGVPENPPQIQGFLLHSTGDTVVGYSNSVLLATQMTACGHPVELVTLPAGMGHSWDKTRNRDQWEFFLANAPMIDDDHDGMADPWEAAHGLDSTTNDAELDSDGDHACNLHEFLAGTDPQDSDSVFKQENPLMLDTGDVVIRWRSVESKLYKLSRATNLMQGSIPVADQIAPTPPLNTYTDQPPAFPVFYRISTQ